MEGIYHLGVRFASCRRDDFQLLESSDRAKIFLKKISHWLSRRDFAFEVLSHRILESGENEQALAIPGVVEKVIVENVLYQIA